MWRDNIDRSNPCFLYFGNRTRGDVVRKEMEIKQRPQKVKRIPSKRTINTLLTFTVSSMITIIVLGIIYYFSPDTFGSEEVSFDNFILAEIVLVSLFVILLIIVGIFGFLYRTKGRSFCYIEQRYDYQSGGCDNRIRFAYKRMPF